MSLQRHGFGPDEEESDSGNIGSGEVAELLGVTRRTVQRNAESLGARQVSGAWVFNRDDIGA
ncbi:MAG: helix-turn-helix domain-containing protein [Mycobacterium sp.]